MEQTQIDATAATPATGLVRIERDAMAAAVQFIAARIVERRNTIPILSCLIIEPGDGEAFIRATDLDMEATATVPAQWESPAPLVLDAYLFADYLKAAPRGSLVTLAADGDGRIRVSAGRAVNKMRADAAGNFPALRATDFPLSWECDAATLSADLAAVRPAISTEETRYYLNGVNIDTRDGLLRLAATDGHRLHIATQPAPFADDLAGRIIPRKAIAELARLLAKHDGAVRIEIGATRARFTVGVMVLDTKLIDGTFPDFDRQVIAATAGDAPAGIWSAPSADIAAVCAAIGKARNAPMLAIDFAETGARYGIAESTGFAAPLPGEYIGEARATAFNASYLGHCAALGGRIDVAIGETVGGLDGPAIVTSDAVPNLTVYLMPKRRDGALPADAVLSFATERTAPGQALNLWDLHPAVNISMTAKEGGGHGTGFGDRIANKARVATNKEVAAYMVDLARRWGFGVGARDALLQWEGGLCIGATFGATLNGNGYTYDYSDGAFSVAMPGAADKLRETVLLSTQADDGSWSPFARCQNAKGEIALPDAKREAKPRKAKAAAPTVTKADADRAAAIMALGDVLLARGDFMGANDAEAAMAVDPTLNPLHGKCAHYAAGWQARREGAELSAMPQHGGTRGLKYANAWLNGWHACPRSPDQSPPPAPAHSPESASERTDAPPAPVSSPCEVEIEPLTASDAPADPATALLDRIARLEAMIADQSSDDIGAAAMALSAETPAPPISGQAPARASRAVRERIVRAYLRMRRGRAAHIHTAKRLDMYMAMANEALFNLNNIKAKRRHAVMNARQLQQRLYAEHKLVDRYAGQAVEAERQRDEARQSLADLRARPTHPDNIVRPDDVQRLIAERDAARQRAAIAEQRADAVAAAVDRVEAQIEPLLRRALQAETANRALQARIDGFPPKVALAA